MLACQGTKMSLTLNELIYVARHSNSNNTSEHAPQVGRHY